MDNFIFGTIAISRGISLIINSIIRFQLFWGFGFGFFVAILVSSFLTTGNSKHAVSMIFQNKTTSFQKIFHHKRKEDGTYSISFVHFSEIVDITKFLITLSIFIFIVIILISIIKY